MKLACVVCEKPLNLKKGEHVIRCNVCGRSICMDHIFKCRLCLMFVCQNDVVEYTDELRLKSAGYWQNFTCKECNNKSK